MVYQHKHNAVTMAVWDTAYVNALPNSAFAWIDSDGGRHLPYKNSSGAVDLPHVRNALARLNQVSGMPASEQASVRNKLEKLLPSDNESKAAELFTTADLTEIKAGEDNLPAEIEVLQEGNWKDMPGRPDFSISASDLDEFADNFNAGARPGVPINVEHDRDPVIGKQAAGWITKAMSRVKDNGKKALFVAPDWNSLGKTLVGDKRFRFVSAEFVPRSLGGQPDAEGKGMLNNVLKKVSLTNEPLMKGLPAIAASEGEGDENTSGLTYQFSPSIIKTSEGNTSVKLDEIRTKEVSDITASEKEFLEQHKSELSAAEVEKFLPETKKEGEKKEVKGGETMTEVSASELAELREKAGVATKMESRIAELEVAANRGVQASEELARNKAEQTVDKHIKRGAVKSDQRDNWVSQLVKASEEDHTALVGMLDGLPDNQILASAKGSTEANPGGGASKQLVEKADEIIKASEKDGKPTIDFAKALMQARADNTVLASEADAEASNGEVV